MDRTDQVRADLSGYGVADGLADGLDVAEPGADAPDACALGLADGVGLGMGGGE